MATYGVIPRTCSHCKETIRGLPVRRDGATLHPACAKEYRPRPAGEYTPFAPQYLRDREEIWGNTVFGRIAEKYRKLDAGDPRAAEVVVRESKGRLQSEGSQDNLKRPEDRLVAKALLSPPAKSRARLRTGPKPERKSRAFTGSRVVRDPEAFRALARFPGYFVAADGRVARVTYAPTNLLGLLAGSVLDRGLIRLTVDGRQICAHRVELVRTAWGEAAALTVSASLKGGAA